MAASGPGLPEIVSLLNVGIVVVVGYVFARKGIKAAIANRSKDIAVSLVEAREELNRTQEKLKELKSELKNLESRKKEIVGSAKEEGQKLAKKIVEEAQQTSDRILSDATLSASSEVQQAMQQLRGELVEQAFAQTLKSLEGSTAQSATQKSELHDKLFTKFVAEIPEKLSSKEMR